MEWVELWPRAAWTKPKRGEKKKYKRRA